MNSFQEPISDSSEQANDKNLLVLIRKKYLWVCILLIIVGVFLEWFVPFDIFLVVLVPLVILLIISLMMYTDLYRFQKISFKYRPFVVTTYLRYLSCLVALLVIAVTISPALWAPDIIPYIILWFFTILIPYQFRSMFTTAKHFKEADPTKCEFC